MSGRVTPKAALPSMHGDQVRRALFQYPFGYAIRVQQVSWMIFALPTFLHAAILDLGRRAGRPLLIQRLR
jgi:hypothetical protein